MTRSLSLASMPIKPASAFDWRMAHSSVMRMARLISRLAFNSRPIRCMTESSSTRVASSWSVSVNKRAFSMPTAACPANADSRVLSSSTNGRPSLRLITSITPITRSLNSKGTASRDLLVKPVCRSGAVKCAGEVCAGLGDGRQGRDLGAGRQQGSHAHSQPEDELSHRLAPISLLRDAPPRSRRRWHIVRRAGRGPATQPAARATARRQIVPSNNLRCNPVPFHPIPARGHHRAATPGSASSTSTSTRLRSTRLPTPPRTSPSAASSPGRRQRSGAG